ncbi:MAG: hypothetical protein Q8P91_03865 [bacterium]|nr:hypothetical protein [bacterium]
MRKESNIPAQDRIKALPIDLHPLDLSTEAQKIIEAGRRAYLFGVFLDPMIKTGINHITDDSMDRKDISTALSTIAKLYRLSGEDYKKQPEKLTESSLATHQRNVLDGNIILVDPQEEMNETNRIAQLKRSNEALSKLPPEIQAIIAELNYEAFFHPQTMADGTKTRTRNELNQLLTSWGAEQDAMPHLTLTNWAIGQIAGGIYSFISKANKAGELKIIDIGSGPGGTVAAITDRLLYAKTENKRLAVTCVETTQGFYDQLRLFTEGDSVIADLGLKVKSLDPKSSEKNISETGSLTTVKLDVLNALKRLDLGSVCQNNIVLITGNYSWHRLDRRTKQKIIDILTKAPNVIFLLGDFAYHGNPVAKQYFCLGANGPLNVGNIGLGKQFIKSGYSLVDLGNQKPASLDKRVAKKIVHDEKDPNVDGHLWIAYKGKLAKQALNFVKSPQ